MRRIFALISMPNTYNEKSMAQVVSFTFNPFAENTLIVFDESGECVIIDPGCYSRDENAQLEEVIATNQWKPVRLLNTHGHIDHVFGNEFVKSNWDLDAEIHPGEHVVLASVPEVARMYGIPFNGIIPPPGAALADGQIIEFGNTRLECILAPGHSPAHICFYCEADHFLIGGDVLFEGSIGRTDLPGGDHETLLNSIRERIYILPDDTLVYPGHGPVTTIGEEARTNPFVRRK